MLRTFTCETCGEVFTRDYSQVAPARRYCSRACMGRAKRLPETLRGASAEELLCTKCGEVKPVSEFYPHTKIARGYQYWCMTCHAESRAERARIPEDRNSIRRRKLREMYGITMADYDALFESQQGRCAICGVQKDPWEPNVGLEGRKRFLTVDHCHADGHIRGLLCANCNSGLGHFRDDPTHLLDAAEYLRRDAAAREASTVAA
jgi:Recombination endonuclease VII